METNHSIQNISGIRNLPCGTTSSVYLLKKEEKLYLSFTLIVQAVVTVFMNTLVLVSIKRTKQQKSRFFYTVRLLSIHDIAAALLGRSASFILLNYDIKNCATALFFTSVLEFLSYLNTGIISFISFDRFLQVKLSQRYQLRSSNKTSNIILTVIVSSCVLTFIQTNLRSFVSVPDFIKGIFMAIYLMVVVFGITCNLATSVILRRYKRQMAPIASCINQRTIRLTQLFILCFVVFKIPLIINAVMWINTDVDQTLKALLYTVINIISNLDAVVNSVIFFFMDRAARCYLKRISLRFSFVLLSGVSCKLGKSTKSERNTPTCVTEMVSVN